MRLGPITRALACLLAAGAAAGRLRLGRLDRHARARAPKTARRRRRAISRPPKGARSPRSSKRPAPRNSSSPRPASVFYKGENRFPFGVFEKDRTQVNDAEVALYLSPVPKVNPKAEKEGAKGAEARAQIKALEEPATGPFPASVESLATQPAFRAQTTSDDPDAATVVYSTDIDFPSDGEWRIAAVIKEGDKLSATLLPSVLVGAVKRVPRVGEKAPADPHADPGRRRRRPLEADDADPARHPEPGRLRGRATGRNRSSSCLRPPSSARVGSAAPSSTWPSRSNRSTETRRLSSTWRSAKTTTRRPKGPGRRCRPSTCPREPWLFAIEKDGTIGEVLQGAFGVDALTEAVEKVAE